MIDILIVDDSTKKTEMLKDYIVKELDNNCEITIQNNIRDARIELIQKAFDLLILDIQLPEFRNTSIKADAGISLLSELVYETRRTKNILQRPSSILVLTEHDDSIAQFNIQFSDSIFKVAKFDGYTDSWHSPLLYSIEHTCAIKEIASTVNLDYDYHIGILCALRKELEFVLELDFNWEPKRAPNDLSTLYFTSTIEIDGRKIKIVCSTPDQMGIADSTIATLKMIDNFKPRCIFMLGIMGGIKSKVNLGDIVFANPCYTHESGKYINGEGGIIEFEPTSTHVSSSTNLNSLAQEIAFNKDLLAELYKSFEGKKPTTLPTVHIGPVSSGNAVIANESILKGIIRNERKLLGVDMEIYGLYRGCFLSKSPKPDFIAFKTVSDYADNTKTDDFQPYCSFISSKLLEYIIINMLIQNKII